VKENQKTMNTLLKSVFFVMLLGVNTAFAADSAEKDINELKQALPKRLPRAVGSEISKTPIKGLYQVVVGSTIIYMTKDARYVIDGDLIDLVDRRNLSDAARRTLDGKRSGERKEALEKFDEKNMLVYQPEGEVKHTITVFTDIYCPYCRRLHDEMDQYMAAGVKVRYMFMTRNSQRSFDTSVSVWCAKDKNEAMDIAKKGGTVESKACNNPIEQHIALAASLGINGTPAIIFADGTKKNPGYAPADKVIKQLEAGM
jgi:thiol:disulfide interchange protein DsbC